MKTILIADDIEINVEVLVEVLIHKYKILTAYNGKEVLDIVDSQHVDLILLDIMMPEMDGYEACHILKSNLRTQDIPVIFITARNDEDSIQKAYELGGIDYITKPFKVKELLARVNREIQLQSLIQNLNFLSSYDEMTKIYNRRKFFELAKKRCYEKKNLYIYMIDIDKFKKINDTYGHAVGDKFIKKVAKTISKNLPKDSIFGRIGGEEFALLLHTKSKKTAIKKANKLRKKIEKLHISIKNSNKILSCTISIGIAKTYNKTKSVDFLLKEADIALYKAKHNGRNQVVFK